MSFDTFVSHLNLSHEFHSLVHQLTSSRLGSSDMVQNRNIFFRLSSRKKNLKNRPIENYHSLNVLFVVEAPKMQRRSFRNAKWKKWVFNEIDH